MKEERCDLLCVDAPRAEAIRGALLDSFPGSAQWAIKLMEFIIFERGCCPFFAFELVFEPGEGPIRLRVRGPEGVKDLVAQMAGSLSS